MNRLPASPRDKRHQRRWKRYEKQRPGHQLQIDVTFVEPITTDTGRKKRFYQYTAIDDCTRLRIYPRSDQKTATGVPELRAVPIFFMRASPSPSVPRTRKPPTLRACGTAPSPLSRSTPRPGA
jgi:hypothetical protein